MNVCQYCNAETTNPKYCSKSCSAKVNNRGVNRHGTPKRYGGYCLNCQKQVKAKYCSVSCQREFTHTAYIEEWKAGKQSGSKRNLTVSNHVRTYLFRKHNSSCSKCGWSVINKHTGLVPLQINHIDGNWMNNKPENLELICPNCHALTENFGSRNKNSPQSRYDARGDENPQIKRRRISKEHTDF